ncbi:extracellular solute-binding protein, partial [Mycobacterium tuberculosis]|nr:extracellular solute-binding protein [Mycobacterium tuberculosis]
PDIATMQEGLFYAIADAGFLVDVSKAVEGVKLNATNDRAVLKGQRLGVGWQRAVYALIYNKTLVDAAGTAVPTDVTGLIAAAKAVQA